MNIEGNRVLGDLEYQGTEKEICLQNTSIQPGEQVIKWVLEPIIAITISQQPSLKRQSEFHVKRIYIVLRNLPTLKNRNRC